MVGENVPLPMKGALEFSEKNKRRTLRFSSIYSLSVIMMNSEYVFDYDGILRVSVIVRDYEVNL